MNKDKKEKRFPDSKYPPKKKADKRAGNRVPKKPQQRIKGWDTKGWENSSSEGIL